MAYAGAVVELPLGPGGLNGSRNQSTIPATQLITANNVSYEGGIVQKEGGASKLNSTAITGGLVVYGGFDWWPDSSTQRLVVGAGTKFLKDDMTGAFATTLASGLNAFTDVVFAEGGKEAAANNRKLFIATGTNQVHVLAADGATTAAVATPPADWAAAFPTFMFEHDGRMWGGGNSNDPHRLYYSTLTNHEDYTAAGAGTISVMPGTGGNLVAATSYRDQIIIWKQRGIFTLDTSTIASPVLRRLSGKTGLASRTAWCHFDNDILFVDQNCQVQSLAAVQEYDDVASTNLGDYNDLNQWIRDKTIMPSYLSSVRLVAYTYKREIHIGTTAIGGTSNNTRIILDFSAVLDPDERGRVRFRTSDRDVCQSLWTSIISGTETLMMGDRSGFVWKLDQSTLTKDGSAYTGEFQTAHTDLSFADPSIGSKRKNVQFLEMVFEPVGSHNLDVDIILDGQLANSVSFNMGATGGLLDSFVLDTDSLGGEGVYTLRKRITGSGKRVSLRCRNSGVSQNFRLSKAYLHFSIGDERDTSFG